MGGKVEITPEDGKRWLDRLQQAIDEIEGDGEQALLAKHRDLAELKDWTNKVGFTVDGQDLQAKFAQRGETLLQVGKDTADALRKRYNTVKAKLDAQFGADWESKVNIDKITDRIDQVGH